MNKEFTTVLEKAHTIVMFENWLRFYFILEDSEGKLFITVPDKSMDKLQTKYPDLVGLAKQLNNQEIDHKRSVETVCYFISLAAEGKNIPDATVSKVFDSREFQLHSNLFSTWVQSHEEQLDKTFLDFDTWKKLFEEWKETSNVKQYIKKFNAQLDHTVDLPSETLQ